MKNVKGKDDLQFNPADYGYMDAMPLDGWIWEMIRRSDSYKYEYDKLEDAVINSKESLRESFNSFNEKMKRMGLMIDFEDFDMVNNADSNFFLLVKTNIRIRYRQYIPKPESKYPDVRDHLGISGIEVLRVESYEEYMKDQYKFLAGISEEGDEAWLNPDTVLINDLAIPTPEHTIYVGISRKGKMKDIEKKLLPLLRTLLQDYRPKVRDDRWKYYLITHDLKNRYPYASYDDIADSLAAAYPSVKLKKGKKIEEADGGIFFSAKNCENFYKSALTLINGEYKKYLYL